MEPLVLTLLFSSVHRRQCLLAADGRSHSRLHTWSIGHGPPQSMPQARADMPHSREASQPIHRRCRPLLARSRSLLAAVLYFPRRAEKKTVASISLSLCVYDRWAQPGSGSRVAV
jgi:hypothetical protein